MQVRCALVSAKTYTSIPPAHECAAHAPCRAIAPKFVRAARKLQSVADFYMVDTVAAKPFCRQCAVKNVPAAHVYSQGALRETAPIELKRWDHFVERLHNMME